MPLRHLNLLPFLATLAFGAAPEARIDEKHRGFLKEYCVECHNADKQKGKLRLDDIALKLDTVQLADRWQKILNQINSGEMPPGDSKQPASTSKADFLEMLSDTLVTARKTLGDTNGQISMRRLNRREYKNTLRDLLGVDISVNELPADGGAGSFDTVGASLFMSSDQFEQYLALGRQAIDEHAIRFHRPTAELKFRVEAETNVNPRIAKSYADRVDCHERYVAWTEAVDKAAARPENATIVAKIEAEKKASITYRYYQWKRIPGAPSPEKFGYLDAVEADQQGRRNWVRSAPQQRAYLADPATKTGSYLTYADVFVNRYQAFNIPGDWQAGKYTVRVRIAATANTPKNRHFVEFGPAQGAIASTHAVTGTMDDPQILEIPVEIGATGSRGFFLRERGSYDSNERAQQIFGEALKRNGIGPEFAIWIDWIECEAVDARRPGTEVEAAIPTFPEGASETGHARSALTRFALRAFRGKTPAPEYVDKLVALFAARRAAGDSIETALKQPLSAILASPGFLYLQEPLTEKQRRRLDDIDLAARLSYFLWSAPPDAELLRLAQQNQLRQPAMLSAQVDRLIADPKSSAFVTGFSHQWLGLHRLDFFQFDTKLHKDFDESTKAAARNEVYHTIDHVLRHGDSLSRLLKSDYVVINGLLADYYGLSDVSGDTFRKVTLPKDSPRGGLLGMAAVLAMGSNGRDTSPVERGAWILRKVLHEPPPPAPPNVPQLNRFESKILSTRERLAAHQEEPQCAQCHRKIDPLGFGLENFDAAGKWRTTEIYEKKGVVQKIWPIAPAGAFYKGASFKDYFELRDQISAQPEKFARGFTEALVEYGLGRPFGFLDEPLAADMITQARSKDYQMSAFIRALILSDTFQTK